MREDGTSQLIGIGIVDNDRMLTECLVHWLPPSGCASTTTPPGPERDMISCLVAGGLCARANSHDPTTASAISGCASTVVRRADRAPDARAVHILGE